MSPKHFKEAVQRCLRKKNKWHQRQMEEDGKSMFCVSQVELIQSKSSHMYMNIIIVIT